MGSIADPIYDMVSATTLPETPGGGKRGKRGGALKGPKKLKVKALIPKKIGKRGGK